METEEHKIINDFLQLKLDEPDVYSSLFDRGDQSSESEDEMRIEIDFTSEKIDKRIKSEIIVSLEEPLLQSFNKMRIDDHEPEYMEEELEFGELQPLFGLETLGTIQEFIEEDIAIYRKCIKCYEIIDTVKWCRSCSDQYFRSCFSYWTTGNHELDIFLRQSQLDARKVSEILEFVNYNQFFEIKFFEEIKECIFSSGIWRDGPIEGWNFSRNKWNRRANQKVTLKIFKNSENNPGKIYRQLLSILQLAKDSNDFNSRIRCFGISRNVHTGEFFLIYEYSEKWNIYEYLQRNQSSFNWHQKLFLLNGIARDLAITHQNRYIHGDFHNSKIISRSKGLFLITEIINEKDGEPSVPSLVEKSMNSLIPFIAPEVLLGNAYTSAADIYSFGVLMWALLNGNNPFPNHADDSNLIFKIYKGLRPEISSCKPRCYIELMRRCWDFEPNKRPKAEELVHLFAKWQVYCKSYPSSGIYFEFTDEQACRVSTALLPTICNTEQIPPNRIPKSLFTGQLNWNTESLAQRGNDYFKWITLRFGRGETYSSNDQFAGMNAKLALLSLRAQNEDSDAFSRFSFDEDLIYDSARNFETELLELDKWAYLDSLNSIL